MKHLPKISKIIVNHYMKKPCVICDLGCGDGELANALSNEGHHVIGVDLSQKSIEQARHKDKTKAVAYLKGDAHKLPFDDESFEAITSIYVLEEVENPRQVVAEAARILRPGGLFFFQTPRSWFLFNGRGFKKWCKESGLEVKELGKGGPGYAVKS